ncbi:hypothetical protein P8452_58837 [Trifolium repens]|nr:hypothetical protein P8452_58837 [Trifolium repens]
MNPMFIMANGMLVRFPLKDVGYGKGTTKYLLDKIAEVEVRHKIPLCLDQLNLYPTHKNRKHKKQIKTFRKLENDDSFLISN